MPTVSTLASGFATSLPASGGAEPCTGSNIATRASPCTSSQQRGTRGCTFALAAIPSPPCSAAPRSVTMSPNRLHVTTTSNCDGSWIM